jgi:hypothetical protein
MNTAPMTPQEKDLWTAALRNGEYKQGKYSMHPTKNTHCCLGVKLVAVDHEPEHEDYDIFDKQFKGTGLDWSVCVNWNDTQNLSFLQIADMIDALYHAPQESSL